MILNGDTLDLREFEKEYPEHSKVLPAYSYAELVTAYFNGELGAKGLKLPWDKTHGNVALRPGEVSIWAGINGHGKSLLLNQVMLNAIKHDESVCIASLEMKPHMTLARMTRQASGVELPPDQFIRAFHEWLDNRLWLYDQQGTVNADRILSVMRYCDKGLTHRGRKLTIRHFVIDSLMKCGIGVDDYNRQKAFIDRLCAFARDSGIHVHLVAHSRKGESEHKVSDKFDIKGTSEITDQVDNVFTLWRNKRKEYECTLSHPDADLMNEPDALLICSKQRHGEWEGRISLWFHPESMQYVAAEGLRPLEYFNYSREAYEGVA